MFIGGVYEDAWEASAGFEEEAHARSIEYDDMK